MNWRSGGQSKARRKKEHGHCMGLAFSDTQIKEKNECYQFSFRSVACLPTQGVPTARRQMSPGHDRMERVRAASEIVSQ